MQRWTSSYRFEWTPIVTFARRQLLFLDWIEENLDPVSFYDRNGVTGVALVSRNVRLTVDRRGVVLEDGSAVDAGVSLLGRAVEGVFDVLQPKDVELKSASVAWSHAIDRTAYNEARAALARSLSGINLDDESPVPLDISALMDVLTPSYRGQVEWGVVSASELLERLAEPKLGRLSSNRPEAALPGVDAEDLPEASLFIDTTFWPVNPPDISDAAGIAEAVQDVNNVSESMADALYSRSKGIWGEHDELDSDD